MPSPSPKSVVPRYTLRHGDAALVLKEYPAHYFSGVLCDPPYEGVVAYGKHGGNAWEKTVQGPLAYAAGSTDLWSEVFRVLKPGAYVLAASASRTYHRIASHIEAVGFEVVDQVDWLYTASMPNVQLFGKGRGSRLWPAKEPYVLACKPREGTMVANLRKHGIAGLSVEECRTAAGDLPRNVLFHKDVRRMLGIPRDARHYFFSAKAGGKERVGVTHPTLKPLALCEYLARLIRPTKGGAMLVPFSGAGSEVIGALWAGWPEVVGVERELQYVKQARKRVPKWCPGVV